jgi:hypothetical protein
VHPHIGDGQTATIEHVIEPCPAFPAVYFQAARSDRRSPGPPRGAAAGSLSD